MARDRIETYFSKNLKLLRKKKHWSQEKLAEEVGVTQTTVSSWENNGVYPQRYDYRNKLLEKLECTESELFGYEKPGISYSIETIHDPESIANNVDRLDIYEETEHTVPIHYETTLAEDCKKYGPDYGRQEYLAIDPFIKQLYPDAKAYSIKSETCNKVIPKFCYIVYTRLDFKRYNTKICLVRYKGKLDVYRLHILNEDKIALLSDSYTEDINIIVDKKDIEILGKVVWFCRNLDN